MPTIKTLLHSADSLLITAGAGMGVDSGLPDFRGNSGMWQAYPELGRRQMDFATIASPPNLSPKIHALLGDFMDTVWHSTKPPRPTQALVSYWHLLTALICLILSLPAMWTGNLSRQGLTLTEFMNVTALFIICNVSYPALIRFGRRTT